MNNLIIPDPSSSKLKKNNILLHIMPHLSICCSGLSPSIVQPLLARGPLPLALVLTYIVSHLRQRLTRVFETFAQFSSRHSLCPFCLIFVTYYICLLILIQGIPNLKSGSTLCCHVGGAPWSPVKCILTPLHNDYKIRLIKMIVSFT